MRGFCKLSTNTRLSSIFSYDMSCIHTGIAWEQLRLIEN